MSGQRSWKLWGTRAAILASFVLVGCTSIIGAGVAVGIAGAAVLASECYDHVQVQVRDGATGGYTCDARVTVSNGDHEQELLPCYHAQLTEGTWTLRASLPGRAPQATQLKIERNGECEPSVQSVELTLETPGLPAAVMQPTQTLQAAPGPAAPAIPDAGVTGPVAPESAPTRGIPYTPPPPSGDAGS